MMITPRHVDDEVVLVDASDRALGTAEKMAAHRNGWLHRAVSVFVFTSAGDVLMQERAREKYHSAGLWANTCCGHPRSGETPVAAAHRRLRYEMGMACTLHPAGSFIYRADVPFGLVEHEFDHVFVGVTEDDPVPDRREVNAWRRVSALALDAELLTYPERFAAWFPLVWRHVSGRRRGILRE